MQAEKPKRLKLKESTIKQLFSKAGNQCSFSGCDKKIINDENNIVGQICHIEAAERKGQRFNSKMSNESRRSGDNLILLCYEHHIETNDELKFSPQILLEIKRKHENEIAESISKFSKISELKNGASNSENFDKAIQLLIEKEDFFEKQKIEYKIPKNYIQRQLHPANVFNISSEKGNIIELIKTKDLIVILGVAGLGKSIELEYLAYHYSDIISDDYCPILIRLNHFSSSLGLNKLIEEYFSNIEKFKNQKLLFLLDGLDEVNEHSIGEACTQISLLKKEFKFCKVVVTCRNNFYSVENAGKNGRIEGFDSYYIDELNDRDISEYCHEKLGNSKGFEFLQLVRTKGFYQLLNSPFYLIHLLESYQITKTLPNSKKEIFEYLISSRISRDIQEKYINTVKGFDNHRLKLENVIQKLAFATMLLGRNYLTDKEFQEIVDDVDILEKLKYTFLFDKDSTNNNWEFEHNNFREYLCAISLSKLSVKEIIAIVAFPSDYTKIKPFWLNTLALLFSILEKDSLKLIKLSKWIIDIEPDVLIRFEKDKIPLNQRESIFKKLYLYYLVRNLSISSEKFSTYEMVNFVSESEEIIDFLLTISSSIKDNWKLSELIGMLPLFELSKTKKQGVVSKVLEEIILRENTDEYVRYNAFYSMSYLDIYSENLTQRVFSKIDLDTGTFNRSGFYFYLRNSPNIDLYVDFLVEGVTEIIDSKAIAISSINRTRVATSTDLPHNLEFLIKKCDSLNLVKVILQNAINSEPNSLSDFNVKIIGICIDKAVNFTNHKVFDFFDEVETLLKNFSRSDVDKLWVNFSNYFSKTDASVRALLNIIALPKAWESNSTFNNVAVISDKKCIDYVVKGYKDGKISEDYVFNFWSAFSYKRDEKFVDDFLFEINEISNNKFKPKPQANYNKIKLNKINNDVDLILVKEKFITALLVPFEKAKKDSFTFEDLFDYDCFEDDLQNNNIVLKTMREEARESKVVSKAFVEKFENEENWNWFQLSTILDIDVQNTDFDFSNDALDFLNDWIENVKDKLNFSCAVYLKNNKVLYKYLEHYFPYVVRRVNYELPVDRYLDYLFLIPGCILKKNGEVIKTDEFGRWDLNLFLVDKVGLEKVKQRVIENIRNERLIDFHTKFNHCLFCYQYSLIEANDLMIELLISVNNHWFEKKKLISWIANLNQNLKVLEKLIPELEEDLKFHCIEELVKKNNDFSIQFCTNHYSDLSDPELKFDYLKLYHRISSIASFKIYSAWIKIHKRIPEFYFDFSIGADLQDLLDLYEHTLEFNYGSNNGAFNNKYVFLQAITTIGSLDAEKHKFVRNILFQWLKKFKKNETQFLIYEIQKLDILFYSQKPQSFKYEEVLKMLKGDFSKSLVENVFKFVEIKPKIWFVSLNVNKIIDHLREKRA